MNWKTGNAMGSSVLEPEKGDYFVSYNPHPPIGYEGEETALVVGNGEERKYLILLGDYRDEYKKAIEKDGFGGALAVFNAHSDRVGSWSNSL